MARIEDYAIIGDCQTSALVGLNGSIDWLCWPRFDSGACFAALLGSSEHGRWLIAPRAPRALVTRRYRDDTLILETTAETKEGVVKVIDFMPIRSSVSDLVRIVVGVEGRVAMEMELVLRFNYGASIPWVTRLNDGSLRAIAGPDMTVLRTPVELRSKDFKTSAHFAIKKGETIPFVLTYGASHLGLPDPLDGEKALPETEAHWREWIAKCPKVGEWSSAVRRSLITLKALTYSPTGGIVAAATTSLPEQIGGVRNWDYRYCWLRDATLTLLALMNANYFEEAQAWCSWLERAVAGSPDEMQIMYGLAGERRLQEWVVQGLPGYEGSRPVRVGNAAAGQLQLDVYGELMDTLHQGRKGGLASDKVSWRIQMALVEHVSRIWTEPDAGMWEIRGKPRHFTYSKVMAWVAVDRAIQGVESFGLEGPVDAWKSLRNRIHEDVCAKGYSQRRGCFVQSYDSDELDASLLLIPLTGFLPASDARVQATLASIERELTEDGLVRRYRTQSADDGLPSGEGYFIACSFWMVDNLVLQGRLKEARDLFERLLKLCNDVGLLSEEYDPKAMRQLGNFPQAFSHIGLINSAFNLSRYESPAKQRTEKVASAIPETSKADTPTDNPLKVS